MRLIDADRLAVDEVVSIYLKGVQEHFGLFSYPKCEIDEAPTVEAIPIEWFKQKMDRLLENEIFGAEVYQWVLNRWYEDKEYWEKENGRSE